MDLFGFRRRCLARQTRKGIAKVLATKVNDIMTDYVVTVSPEKSIVDAAAVMVGEDVSALVVEQNSKPIGILTERDFISKVPVSQKALTLPVKEMMSHSFSHKNEKGCAVESVQTGATLTDVHAALKKHHIRKLVVTSPDGFIAGIVTQTDLSKVLYEQLRVVPRIEGPFLVQDVMTRQIKAVQRRSSFAEAKRLMAKDNLSALPVLDGKEFVGIFTEYDVVTQFYDAGGKLDLKDLPALMKSPIKAIPAGVNIFDANTVMLFEKVRRLLVVDDKKAVIGIITQTDLVHACMNYLEKAQQRLAKSNDLRAENFTKLKQRTDIISEYAGEHIRTFTVR